MAAYGFGPFVLDVGERLLVREGRRVPLTGKSFQILQLLVEAGGRLVGREAFQDRLWSSVTVEERNLTVHIATLRRVLGRADSPLGYVETVYRSGYRLTVPVSVVASPEPPSAEPLPMQNQSLAVLPFSTKGLTEADGYLGMGIADGVITQLGSLPGFVVQPTRAIKDIGGDRDAVEVGRTLRAGHVLQGTVQRHAQRLSVSTQLIDVASGAVRWRENFEQPTESGFALQDAIAARVASSLTTLSAEDRAGLHSHRPKSSEAYFLQLQARTNLRLHARIPAMKALGLFEQVVELDPDYAVAHAGLASTYLLLGATLILRPLPVAEAAELARQSAERALALDPTLAEAWNVLGRLKMDHERDWLGAEADLVHAVTLNPNEVDALAAYAQLLSVMGRYEEAIEAFEQARGLDPHHMETIGQMAGVWWMVDQPQRALAILEEARTIEPKEQLSAILRSYILHDVGLHDEALADLLAIMGEYPAWLNFKDELVELHRRQGWKAAMRRWTPLVESNNSRASWAAAMWMALGEPQRALDALERAVAELATHLPFQLRFPCYRSLYGEPRFRQIARTLKLDDQFGGYGDAVPARTAANAAQRA